jgi:hypothetical protein
VAKGGVLSKIFKLFLLAVFLFATGASAKVGLNSSDILGKVPQGAESYGDLITQGTIFPLKGDRSKPLYFFERRVRNEGSEIQSTSYTHDGQKPVLVETAIHDANFKVREFTENQFQLGTVGKMTVDGNKVYFFSVTGTKDKWADEAVTSLPIVCGPTFFGFMYKNWDSLMAGNTVPFRYAVISRMETVGFEFQKVESAPNQIRIRMKPTSYVISLLVNPIHFTFASDKSLLTLEGRVPPKIKKGDGWDDLDAYEVYKNIAPAFK